MKKLLLISILISTQTFAGCLEIYNKVINEREDDQKQARAAFVSILGLGVMTSEISDDGVPGTMSAIAAMGIGAREMAREDVTLNMMDVRNLIQDSNHSQSDSILFETQRINEKHDSELSTADVANAILTLDGSNAFCPEGQALKRRAFRNVLEDYLFGAEVEEKNSVNISNTEELKQNILHRIYPEQYNGISE